MDDNALLIQDLIYVVGLEQDAIKTCSKVEVIKEVETWCKANNGAACYLVRPSDTQKGHTILYYMDATLQAPKLIAICVHRHCKCCENSGCKCHPACPPCDLCSSGGPPPTIAVRWHRSSCSERGKEQWVQYWRELLALHKLSHAQVVRYQEVTTLLHQ